MHILMHMYTHAAYTFRCVCSCDGLGGLGPSTGHSVRVGSDDGRSLPTLVHGVQGASSSLLPRCGYPLGFLANPGSLQAGMSFLSSLSDFLGPSLEEPSPHQQQKPPPKGCQPPWGVGWGFRVGCNVKS